MVEDHLDLSFDLYLVKGMPSSLEVSEPHAQVQISYTIEITGYYQEQLLQHQLHVPVMATIAQHQIDEQEADQQQTNEVAYLVASSSNAQQDPCRSAARITVPCKIIPRGTILPVVGHIWHDHSHSREKVISLALIRYTTITCHEREETLVHEMDTSQFDLELVEHQDYAVQTLSQTLWIPPECIPSMDISAGRLVNVRYQIRLKVDIEPDAVYTHAENQYTTDTMAVDVPLIIFAKGDTVAAPSPSASTESRLSQPTTTTSSSGRLRNSVNLGNNGRMRERFKSMFKKRDSVRLNSSTMNDTSNNKPSSTTSLRGAFGSLKIKSSNNTNSDNQSSSINTTTATTNTTTSSSRNSSVTGSISPPHSSSLPPKAFSSLSLPSPPPPPQSSSSITEAISQDAAPPSPLPTVPLSLPILRSLSIKHPSSAERQQSTLPMMTSTTTTITEPVPPIPLVEGGGVYTFHIFADSSDEEDNVGEESKIQGTQTSSLSRSASFLSSVGKQGSLDTTAYNHSNEDDQGNIHSSDTEDTQIYTVSSAGIGKLDQVSDSSDDQDLGGNSSEEDDDLLSLLAKRERRIERKKERGSSSRQKR
ncbi:hypothetical protein K492DRAFT_40168 [Lichtheimia hyalospora FSU 10163]|nr:hypothetical protein K492DRAFT_40168 [Lichtheimia hyalospora FSU 10163]